jgi:hypothetical protein
MHLLCMYVCMYVCMYGYNQISSALNTAKTDAYNGSLHHCALCKKPNRVTLHSNRYNLGN